MWQDYVLAVAQWIFALALIPTILHKKHKPSFFTGLLTATLMVVVTGTYYSLNLTGSWIAASAVTVCWIIITTQRFLLNRQDLPAGADLPWWKWRDIILMR